MTINLTTDSNNQETSLNVHDLTTGSIIYSISAGSQAANTTQTYMVCANSSHCFKADLLDAAGNGGASFTIVFQSQTYSSATSYGFISTALMGTAACTDLSPVLDSASYFIKSAGPIKMGSKNSVSGSMLAGSSGGNICMGDRNGIRGWVKGDKISLGNNNSFSGYQGIDLFGNDYGINVCNQSSGLPGSGFHVTPDPMSNTTDDCEDIEVVPSNNDITLAGPGAFQTIGPGQYGKVTLSGGATLRLHEGAYSIEEIDIDGAKLAPVIGGILCEVLISTDKLAFTNGSTVKATINCKSTNIGEDNIFEGWITMDDPGETMYIGDRNKLSAPTCLPCESMKNKGNGSIDDQPRFQIWPNPSDSGEIRFSNMDAGQLEVYSLEGKLVASISVDGPSGRNGFSVNVQHLKPGMYIGKMTQASGAVARQKFQLL